MSGTISEPPAFCESTMEQSFGTEMEQSFAEQFDTNNSSYDSECSLRPFNLLQQQQDTRVVVFGRIVFKLKYKMSKELTPDEQCLLQSPGVQEEVKRVTEGILFYICKFNKLRTIRSNHIFIHPGTKPWSLASMLVFMENNQELLVHPDVIFLVVHLATDNSRPVLPLLTHKLVARKRRRSAPSDHNKSHHHKRRRHGFVVQEGKGMLLRKPLTSSLENYTQIPVDNAAALPTATNIMEQENCNESGDTTTPGIIVKADNAVRHEEEGKQTRSTLGKLFSFIMKPLYWSLGWK